jgi:hypothetical protein
LPKLISGQIGSASQPSPHPVGGRFLVCRAAGREYFLQFEKISPEWRLAAQTFFASASTMHPRFVIPAGKNAPSSYCVANARRFRPILLLPRKVSNLVWPALLTEQFRAGFVHITSAKNQAPCA